MLRYYVIATTIVGVALAAILALPGSPSRRDPGPRYAQARGTPGPVVHDDFRHAAEPVTGDAPWALSALPACFHQRSGARGPAAFARRRIPRGARRVGGASTLRVADCTLVLRGDAALVTRGENRLVIPAVSRFYVAGNRLVLDRTDGAHDDVRVYVLAGGAVPRFVPEPARKP